jgi:hypothetical protein
MSACEECSAATSSNEKLCAQCSGRLKQCEACRQALPEPWDLTRAVETEDQWQAVQDEIYRLGANPNADWERIDALVALADAFKKA